MTLILNNSSVECKYIAFRCIKQLSSMKILNIIICDQDISYKAFLPYSFNSIKT